MLWKRLIARAARKTAKPRKARPQVEALEDRTTPSTLVALTSSDNLLFFDSANPRVILNTLPITNLPAGEDLVGIDFRPATGQLFGVGQSDRLYQISLATGVATPVGASPFAVSLSGRRFGVDVNPVVDRFRAVSDTDQNLRLNPNDGTTVDGDATQNGVQPDGALAYAAGDRFENRDPTIVGSAYTNNFAGATTTTLYGIDATLNTLVRQGGLNVPPGTPSPNTGQLFTVGSLGLNVGTRAGFDIAPDGTAYASFTTGRSHVSRLYTIDLNTGNATLVGTIGNGQTIDGLTAVLREEIVYGVTASNRLVTFSAAAPEVILRSVPISNLQPNETIVGIDIRTATGQLYGLGSSGRQYVLNPATGQAVQIGNSFADQAAPALVGASFGFDTNPTVDRLRGTSDANQNFRLNPVNGAFVDGNAAVAGIQGDTDLAYVAAGDPASGQDPNVVASAYDRNDNDPTTPTTLFAIDSTRNTLVRQGAVDGNAQGVGGSPNGGQLFTVGALGVDITDQAGFDIAGTGVPGSGGVALAALQVQGESVSRLFTINLSTGAAQSIGTIGAGEVVHSIAIAPPAFQFSAPTFSATENGTAVITVTRTGGSRGTATVQFSTSDGSAQAGSDYVATMQTLTFADGETSKQVTIPLVNDRVREPVQTVNLTLSSPTGGTNVLGNQATAVLFILDDDGPRGGRPAV